MRLDRIRVLPFFKACPPSGRKMELKRRACADGLPDKPILITRDGWLLDGYATYLALLEQGAGEASVETCDVLTPSVRAAGLDGKDVDYSIPIKFARRAGPGDLALVFPKGGKPSFVAVLSLDVKGRQGAVPARAFVVRRAPKQKPGGGESG